MTTMRAVATATIIYKKQQQQRRKWRQRQWLAVTEMVAKAVVATAAAFIFY